MGKGQKVYCFQGNTAACPRSPIAGSVNNVTYSRLPMPPAPAKVGQPCPTGLSYAEAEMTATWANLEQPRLEAAEPYDFAAMPHDPALDDIARLAAQLCGTPMAAVAVLERDRVLFLGRHGTDCRDAPRCTLPCETTVEAEGVYQIPDTRRDPAFAAAGILLGDDRYRFYAGAPVHTTKGVAIGTVCVMDSDARRLSPTQIDSLASLSRMVTTRLELVLQRRETQRTLRAQQRLEAAPTIERNFIAAVLDTVGALVVVFDPDGRIVRFNRACEIISGYPASDLVGHYPWERLVPAEDVASSIEGFEALRRGSFPTAFENQWLAADGTRRRISWSATALLDSHAEVSFIIATGLDVTVQRVAESTMRESEARYRQIVEGSLGLVFTHDLEGKILSINEHGAQSFGRHVQHVVGHELLQFLVPEHRGFFQHYLSSLLATGEAQGLMHLRHLNGEKRVLAYRNRLVEPADGPRYALGFAIDITDQVRAEEQLHSLIRQSNSVLESIGDGIYSIDLEGRVTVVNPAAAQMLGYQPEELLGRKMHELVHHTRADGRPYPESECPIRRSVHHLNMVRVANEVFWRKDGTSFPVEYVARPQIEAPPNGPSAADGTARGRAVGVVVAFTDISERYALDRMKDEFISTVSHELRTPLTSLRAALGLIAGGALIERPDKAQQMMEMAVGSADRLTRLVNDILDLERIGSGKAQMHFCSCSVEELFKRATAQLQAPADKANIRFTVEPNDVVVWCDPDRVLQMLTNLISNAIKFSPPASVVPSEIRLAATVNSQDEALIEVQDYGRGIAADKLQSIFERFKQGDASDSRSMGGTGLGLAICRAIIAQQGGSIWATSTLGKGSTFHFSVPMQPGSNLR